MAESLAIVCAPQIFAGRTSWPGSPDMLVLVVPVFGKEGGEGPKRVRDRRLKTLTMLFAGTS